MKHFAAKIWRVKISYIYSYNELKLLLFQQYVKQWHLQAGAMNHLSEEQRSIFIKDQIKFILHKIIVTALSRPGLALNRSTPYLIILAHEIKCPS